MRFSLLLLLLLSCTYNEVIIVCEPEEEIYTDLVKPIIEANCVICHNESSGRPALLTSYNGVINALNNNELVDWVVTEQMPPYGMTSLDISDINILKNWANCE